MTHTILDISFTLMVFGKDVCFIAEIRLGESGKIMLISNSMIMFVTITHKSITNIFEN